MGEWLRGGRVRGNGPSPERCKVDGSERVQANADGRAVLWCWDYCNPRTRYPSRDGESGFLGNGGEVGKDAARFAVPLWMHGTDGDDSRAVNFQSIS